MTVRPGSSECSPGDGRELSSRAALARWLSGVISGTVDPASERVPEVCGGSKLVNATAQVRECAGPGEDAPADSNYKAGAPAVARVGREAERVRLFVNAPGGIPAPPYGSWWLDEQIDGPTTRAVADFYRREGLQIESGTGPADYLGAELEFLYFLLQHRRAAVVTGHRDLERHSCAREKEFLETHLSPWLPKFCSAGRHATQHKFWLATLQLLEAFIEDEWGQILT